MKKLSFVVELDNCIGCKGCQVACKMENGVALGSYRSSVKTIGPTGIYPDIEMYFIPVMCQQCENAPCVSVCPTGACHVDAEDGVVLIDSDLCIGCKSCQRACPYELNNFNAEMRIMDKCTICVQRREEGEEPACVRNCCGRALHVGDLSDPQSEVSKLLASTDPSCIYTLRNFDNDPRVRYILKNAKWQDILPQEILETRRGEGR